jgi:FixJ family two-component response regulator
MTAVRPLVAVVDDEESVRRALARMLTASMFDVEVFASGQEFLDSARRRRPDCVVLDFQMPLLTGRDVQRQLALWHIRLPIIMVTAHDQPELREQCLADGAVAYLAKPLQRQPLVNLINGAIKMGAMANRRHGGMEPKASD